MNVPDENPSGLGAFEFPMRFPGQYADRETGLAYNYFRDFNSQLGSYIESDPIGLAAGMNTYLYVSAMPLLLTDPKGLKGMFPEIPKSPEDVIKQEANPDRKYGQIKGLECAKKCSRIKNRPSYLSDYDVINDICLELLPLAQGHLRGGTQVEACIKMCKDMYPYYCQNNACAPNSSQDVGTL